MYKKFVKKASEYEDVFNTVVLLGDAEINKLYKEILLEDQKWAIENYRTF